MRTVPGLVLALLQAQTQTQSQPQAPLEQARQLEQQVDQLFAVGKYAEAATAGERALAMMEKLLPPDHPDIGTALSNLSAVLWAQGAFERAESLARRALAIREKALGPEHREVANSLNNLGQLYESMGAYGRAEPLFRRALAIREKVLGPRHPEVGNTLNNLAALYVSTGDYARAEPLQKRALEIYEAAYGPNHARVATALNNLALVYKKMGELARAEPLYQRALAIHEGAQGQVHPDLTNPLNNLALLYTAMGQPERAEPLYRRALALREAAVGPAHPSVATVLVNLGSVLVARGQAAAARPLLERALRILEQAHGPNHPRVAAALASLAALHASSGAWAQAEPLARRTLAIMESAEGPQHPDVATAADALARLLVAAGRTAEALPLEWRALAIGEHMLRAVSGSATEARMAAFLARLREQEEVVYSLAAERPQDPEVRRLALAVALLRKGRTLDEAADTSRALARDLGAPEREALERLRALRTRFARASLDPGEGRKGFQENLVQLSEQAQQIEQELAVKSAPLRAQRALPAPEHIAERVAAALPPASALIEVVAFRHYRFRATFAQPRWGALEYVALTLGSDGTIGAVPLGRAAGIDAAVAALRTALTDPARDPIPAARALERRVMAPLRRLTTRRTDLVLSLDGPLQLVPFETLHDGRSYLIDRGALTYVTSGRDLLRGSESRSRSPAALLADPAFTSPTVVPLPATREEAAAIRALLPSARLLVGSAASKPALLALDAPALLHVATHGVFQDDQTDPPDGTRGLHLARDATPPPRDPLVRSALLLAGEERATALEVAGMNLQGTELVVLSACDTGRGDVRLGQGVYGLRRAVLIAGAETLVISLWRVDDAVTRELMTGFYQNLLAGRGRAEALRTAAQAVRAAHPHPYYWAPFVLVGAGGKIAHGSGV